MKRIAIGMAVVAVLFAGGYWWVTANMGLLMQRLVEGQVTASLDAQEISATRFEVLFCGTGSPQFHEDRAQPCTAILAGGRLLLFDAGQGTVGQLNKVGAPTQLLDAVFLTHLHSDHMSGLGETLHNGWLYGRQHLIEIFGPPGTEGVLEGFQQVYADDLAERQRVVGHEYLDTQSGMGHATDVQIDDSGARVVYNKDGVIVSAFRVEHPDWPYAYGYRINFGNQSVVISGDTRYTPAIAEHASGADMLIHEVVNLEMMSIIRDALAAHDTGINPERMDRISAVHTPTLEVARVANEAQAERLVLTHLIPPIPAIAPVEEFFIEGMDDIFRGEITVARDGMRILLSQ